MGIVPAGLNANWRLAVAAAVSTVNFAWRIANVRHRPNAKTALAETLQKMNSVDSKISNDTTHLDGVTQSLTKIANDLDALGSKIATNVNSLNSLSVETQKQKNEISNL